jgi:aminoglycoside phosphotransferase (APT) family kinase protein
VGAWDADIVVDEDVVRSQLVRFPELAAASLRPLAEGWDRSVWLVDEQWVFGFPRRAVAAPGITREVAFLPRLAPALSLPVPSPRFVGEPTADFPWPFFGSAHIPGRELAQASLDDAGRHRLAKQLAGFLRELHSPRLAAAVRAELLPLDLNRRADMRDRVAKARAQLADCARLGLWSAPKGIVAILSRAERLPAAHAADTVLHGDLHVRHVLVDDDGASGVIDWIDLCRGEPAVDLSLLWSAFEPDERTVFLGAYGPVTEEQLLRARVLACSLNAALALYARGVGNPRLERAAVDGLERTARD